MTLVEFGDYECRPCAHYSAVVAKMLKKYPGKVRFQFRNFPNPRNHPHSLAAAIAAEETRTTGNFWKAHEELYQHRGDVNSSTISDVSNLARTKSTIATRFVAGNIVESDIRLGRVMNVTHTPTFFICQKDGTVFQLNSLNQAEEYLM